MKRTTRLLFNSISVFILCIGCNETKHDLKIVDSILNDSSSYFYTNLDNYESKDKRLPIGVFDSGTGGLTVLDAIVNFDKFNNGDHSFTEYGDSRKDFNEECFIYLADQANMPYGNYAAEDKEDLLREHILKDMQFLMSDKYYQKPNDKDYQMDKSLIKAMIIACNTATAFGKEDIQGFINKAGIEMKVIGVIGAGVRAAISSLNSENPSLVAVMATAGTVASEGYLKEFHHQLSNHDRPIDVNIFQQAGVGIAGAIDGSIEFIDPSATKPRKEYKGPSDSNINLPIDKKILNRYNFDWNDNKMLYEGSAKEPKNIQINSVENYISYHVTSMLEKIIMENDSVKLSTVVLGCTHYPFYTDLFEEKFDYLRSYVEEGNLIYGHVISEQITFIDPAINTAKELYEYLKRENLFNEGNIFESEFYISVPNIDNFSVITDIKGNLTYDYKYGRDVNQVQEYVKRIPFNKNNISSSVLDRLKDKIPFTYDLIRSFNTSNNKTDFLEVKARIR